MLTAMQKPRKRPRDPSQLAKLIVDIATGQAEDRTTKDSHKNPAAVALGRKGGQARAASTTKAQRRQIAKRAAAKRWAAKHETD